ncbi:F-box domain-containing protein [Meloidogyne graminicola]|uniref:F-box domain-containing protein n=1 Tax=Meloidogyne graminicola TaxID=189291 RepID=A0A8S9ZR62_9BILA|nr:F-box domain-containing protein [Meloidogyne graminicola]
MGKKYKLNKIRIFLKIKFYLTFLLYLQRNFENKKGNNSIILLALYRMDPLIHFDCSVQHDGILWDLRFEENYLNELITNNSSIFWPKNSFFKIKMILNKNRKKGGVQISNKSQKMYLITTMLPGTSQQNGHNSTSLQQQKHTHHVLPALINRMLPTELILRVFSYLDITSLCRCAQICRSWNKLSMDGSNWMDVDLFLFQREVKTSVVECLAKRCGNFLKVLSLKGCENVQDNAMRSFTTKCPNIERLTLTKCKLITDATCEYIGRYCSKIVMIDLENCTLITDVAIKFISEGCKYLEELNISWCEQITDLGLFILPKNCTKLRTLFCKGLDNITSNCFSKLGMAELKRLSLHSCPNILDITVNNITKHCPCLEFISLSNCREITDLSLVSIAQGCLRLKDIELAGCINLTDSGFIQLSKNCHELERMDLEECLLITDITLSNLNNGCPNLSSLSLSHCENLTDIGLAELCASHKDKLQVLELDNCPNITDNTLESMKMLQVLERIDLYDCQMITKDAIKKFKQGRPGVEVHAYFAPATPPPQAPPARRGICRCCAIL